MRIVVHDYLGYAFPAQLARSLARRGATTSSTSTAPRSSRARGASNGNRTTPRPRVRLASVSAARSRSTTFGGGSSTSARPAASSPAGSPTSVPTSSCPRTRRSSFSGRCCRAGARARRRLRLLAAGRDQRGSAPRARHGARASVGAAAEGAVATLERRLLRASDGVVVISEDFVPLLRRWGVDEERITVIENWAPLDELPVLPRDNAWAREHGLADRVVFLYSGHARVQARPEPAARARALGGRERSLVAVVSEGPGAEWLAARGRRANRRCGCFPYQPYERLPEVLASADVLVAAPRAGRRRVLGALEGADVSLRRPAATRLGGAKTTSPRGWSSAAAAGSSFPPQTPKALVAAAGVLHADEGFRAGAGTPRPRVCGSDLRSLDRITDRFEQVLERARG